MDTFAQGEPFRPAIGHDDSLGGVKQCEDELQDLQLSDILLPPKILLEVRSGSGECVIRVHDGMNEEIAHWKEAAVAIGMELDTEPSDERHDAVMEDM